MPSKRWLHFLHARYKPRRIVELAIAIVGLSLLASLATEYADYSLIDGLTSLHDSWKIHEVLALAMLILVAMLSVARVRLQGVEREMLANRAAEERARAMACRDALTGLPNRRMFNDIISDHVAKARQGDHKVALLLLDLDRFKPINDLLGHAAGDEALRLVGERLTGLVGPGARVARVGGDEFAIVVPHLDERAALEAVATRILLGFQQPFEINAKPVRMGSSLGIAVLEGGHEDGDSLYRRADMALFQAKRDGRNRFCIHSSELDEDARRQAMTEADLRRGLCENEFVPFFQPLVDLRSGGIVGMEVLARWEHPHKGVLSPGEFIELAERMNVIGELTFQVLRKACIAAKTFDSSLFLAINISQVQLRDLWLPEQILAILNETAFPPERIEIEITENFLADDFEIARSILFALKQHGIQIALDDFGTGYSSLVHLRDLPLDKIKIDRSFVASMNADEGSAKIVSAILGLGTSLGLPTVAEGVECARISSILADFGCIYGQGYLYSKPVPAEHVNDMLRLRASAPANSRIV